jgi:hypothetical protein
MGTKDLQKPGFRCVRPMRRRSGRSEPSGRGMDVPAQ